MHLQKIIGLTKQRNSLPSSTWTVEQMLRKGHASYFVGKVDFIITFLSSVFSLNEFLFAGRSKCCQVIHSSPSAPSEKMLHSTGLQWPCNAILCAAPTGQILWASLSCQKEQGSIFFAPGLSWKPWERRCGDSILIAEGHLHTSLFPVLLSPS